MRLRTRVATVVAGVLLMIGLGSSAPAGAVTTTDTNGCVVIASQIAICLDRLA